MSAKQTSASASILVVLAVASSARAEPVVVEVRPDEAGEAKDQRHGRFEVGAGYTPDDQFTASATVARDNLLGTGSSLSLEASISRRRQQAVARLVDPALFGSGLRLDTSVFTDARLYPGFWRKSAGAQVGLSRVIAPHLTAFTGYRFEYVQVEPEALGLDGARAGTPGPLDYRLATLRSGLEYSTVDGLMPTRGSRAGFAVELADRQLGSEVGFAKIEAWADHHRALGPFGLHLGARASTIAGDAPYSERLHLDGSRDIRGFAPGGLGPLDPRTGMSLGGTGLATVRGELELPIVKRWGLSLVGFVDAGAMESPGQIQFGASAGVGILWRSPIGPLRFDLAMPFGDDKHDGPVPLFSLGGTF